jgi:broad specificity phosphatase PhoE
MLIVRHGESEWNREGRWQGWEDIPLTPAGEAQARARGAELHDAGHRFAAVYTSDLVRAARTADLLAEALGLPAAIADPDLRERFGGEWQGRNREEMRREWPEELAAWGRGELLAPPGGETDAVVLGRVRSALGRIHTATPPGSVLVVTHHGVVRQLTTMTHPPGHTREQIPNLGGRWFDWDGTELRAGAPLPPLDALPDLELE